MVQLGIRLSFLWFSVKITTMAVKNFILATIMFESSGE